MRVTMPSMAERVHLSKVAFDADAAQRSGHKLFMCRHQGRWPAAAASYIAARHTWTSNSRRNTSCGG
jgi:hypothetical protein